ncbi:hypothetical protein [Bacillus thuringiensis]|uniref:hypothetical protein n=1 Tax=Bacillus thuringiensis TaxID=1428 RepID=UPI00103C7B0E|nr:hypothetical protein [Bacillus thuringiensis]TBX38949.1 hypothetical protein E0M35_28655 [Bacillus thuringiensis]
MKKVLPIISLVFFCLAFLLVHSIQLQSEANNLLYKNKSQIYIDYRDDSEYKNLTDSIIAFSNENKISIERHVYTSEDSLNIYRSTFNNFDTKLLKNGYLPRKNSKEFISNEINKIDNKYRSGTINVPYTVLNISIYSFNSLENGGLGDTFYISSDSKGDLEKTVEFLSDFGKVSVSQEENGSVTIIDPKLVIVVSIAFLFLLLAIIYFLELNVKKIGVMHLLGWDKRNITLFFLNKLFKSITFPSLISLVCILVFYWSKGTMFHTFNFLIISLTLTIIVLCLSFILAISLLYIRIFNMPLNNILKGKENTRKLNIINNGSKIIITILIFFFVGKVSINITNLNDEIEQLKYWKNTQNVYSLSLTNLAPEDDLKSERKMNNQFLDFYHLIELEKKAFIMHAPNYFLVDSPDGPKYSYQTRTYNEPELYGLYGQSIVIDKNYLTFNPIKGVLSDNPLENIKNNSNVLNVLVPEKLKSKEDMIKRELINDFYFQKVEVKNIYNKDNNQEMERLTKDELDINIIYVKNNQKYFTYSIDYGSPKEKYKITDPIAIIYNDSIDSSFITAYASSSMYFKDSSKEPYKNIEPYLKTSKTKDKVNFVTSVFNTANTKIVYLESQLRASLTILFTVILLSFLLLINNICIHNKINQQKIRVLHLLGKGFFEINKSLIIFSSSLLLIIGILFFILYKDSVILSFGIILIISEWLIIKGMSDYLLRKNMAHLLKERR